MDNIELTEKDTILDCSLSEGNKIELYTRDSSFNIIGLPVGWEGLFMYLKSTIGRTITLSNNSSKAPKDQRLRLGKDYTIQAFETVKIKYINSQWEITNC